MHLRLMLKRNSICRFRPPVVLLRLVLGCDSIFRSQTAVQRLRLLLSSDSIFRFRVAADTIVTGYCGFVRTRCSCVCFLLKLRNLGNSGFAQSKIGALQLDVKVLCSNGMSLFVLMYSNVNASGEHVGRNRRKGGCGSIAGGGEHCKSSSEGITGSSSTSGSERFIDCVIGSPTSSISGL